MKVVKLSPESFDSTVEEAAEVLRSGGIVLYPTDTLYSLAADALSEDAIGRIYKIKERDRIKPLHAVVADLTMADRYAEVTEQARALAKEFLPGALTIVLKKRSEISTGIAKEMRTIAFRIPANDFCLALARAFDGPFTATSANTSGAASPRRIDEILTQLGERATLIDLVVDAGELPESLPSPIVDISEGQLHILRDGAISSDDIVAILN